MTIKEMDSSMLTNVADGAVANAVQIAMNYDSTIYIENANKKANAKSLMGMVAMTIDPQYPVVISAEGADEEAAVKAMENFLSNM